MSSIDRIRYVIEAIQDVKYRIQEALSNEDMCTHDTLMNDLIALENCLVTESILLLKENDVA